ncbi:hypothetical protein BK138_32275 [Paenibacillus rhizosphaerae]|uniref:Uncharacterized protein n=1 Tax=Paenibacillus rhizosphaerae TaxID=297318 RepID=A0A1R1E678_9BACL|nr:hypothetical protein BK138_32275 [Paenibacillus rhizosphaerae]
MVKADEKGSSQVLGSCKVLAGCVGGPAADRAVYRGYFSGKQSETSKAPDGVEIPSTEQPEASIVHKYQ